MPRIFSILGSWFFSLLLQLKVLRLHVFDCAAPASESQSVLLPCENRVIVQCMRVV